MIVPEDERLHAVGEDPAWQESFYFNWADPERRAFTLARIGYRFHPRKTDGLVVSVRDGAIELFYGPADLDHEGPCDREDPSAGMRAGDLVVTLLEPLKRWRLRIEGERGMDVEFEARTPAFDYQRGGTRLATTMTGAHFEQAGVVTGWTQFGTGDERHEIRALGQRDKSWGVRDWSRLEGWDWLSAQFGAGGGASARGPDLAFNIMQTIEGGRTLDNGFVFRNGENHAVERARVEYRWGEREHEMREARVEIVEVGGCTHRVRAEALASAPIPRNDVWIEETHVAWTLEGDAGAHQGQGVVEHVWRASPQEIQARGPRLAAILPALRRPAAREEP